MAVSEPVPPVLEGSTAEQLGEGPVHVGQCGTGYGSAGTVQPGTVIDKYRERIILLLIWQSISQ